ncbi:hypothetical protein B0H13DRAFT_2331326 [Mycena leptocephala]|nr:hypothetical protein B0H13DRAFT_2331326 [Mycena leptocephala]
MVAMVCAAWFAKFQTTNPSHGIMTGRVPFHRVSPFPHLKIQHGSPLLTFEPKRAQHSSNSGSARVAAAFLNSASAARAPAPPSSPVLAPQEDYYTSARTFSVSNSGLRLAAPASYQPFIGAASLAPSTPILNTSYVNQGRMASSSSTNARAPSMPRRGRRQGVRAQHPPSLVNRPHPDQCLGEGAHGFPIYRVEVQVYPPLEPVLPAAPTDDKQTEFLELLHTVVRDMQNSASVCLRDRPSPVLQHPATTLQPLGLVSKGKVVQGQMKLKMQGVTAGFTIGNLAADRNRYSVEDHSFKFR